MQCFEYEDGDNRILLLEIIMQKIEAHANVLGNQLAALNEVKKKILLFLVCVCVCNYDKMLQKSGSILISYKI